MKRLMSILLMLAMVFTLFACEEPEKDEECSHKYKVVKTISATCTEEGKVKYQCSKCDHTYSVESPKLEHDYQGGSCNSPATCAVCGAVGSEGRGHRYEGYACVVCGDETDTFVMPENGYDGSEVTIVFYHTMGAALRSVLEDYIGDFNAMYPNIHVVHKQVGSFDDVRDSVAAGIMDGSQPNITYCYPDHVALYNQSNAVAALDIFINSTATATTGSGSKKTLGLSAKQINDFIDGFYEGGSQFGDGVMYTLPMSKTTNVLYYNKTFFDTHGLSVPTTWEEMEQVCQQILQIAPNSIPLCIDYEDDWFITMCAQYNSPYTSATGEHYLFDNETNRSFVQQLRDWYQKGYVNTFNSTGGTYGSDYLNREESYMVISASSSAAYHKGNYELGAAGIPQVDPANPKVISWGPDLCILKNDNAQEVLASWLFVKFLTTNAEFQADFSMSSGYLPVTESACEDIVYQMYLDYADGYNAVAPLAIKAALTQIDAFFTPAAFVGSAEAAVEVGNIISYACTMQGNGNSKELIRKIFADAIANCP